MGFSGKESGGSVSGNLQSAAQAQIQAAQQAGQIAQQYAGMSMQQLQNYYNQAVGNLNSFYNQGIAQTAGYNLAGSTALDSLMQSMGLPTVQGGTYAFQQKYNQGVQQAQFTAQQNALIQQAKQQLAQVQNLQSNPNAPGRDQALLNANQALGGTLQQLQAAGVNQQNFGSIFQTPNALAAIQQAQQQTQLPGQGQGQTYATALSQSPHNFNAQTQQAAALTNIADNLGANGTTHNTGGYAGMNSQTADYANQFINPAQQQNQQNQQQLQALQQEIMNPTMVQTTNPLTGFANSAQGKLTNYDPNKSLIENFQQTSPGYQFQLQQGQNAIRNSMAAQGLLNNPQLMAALDQYTTGLANQSFGSYQQNLQTSLGNYQQQLAGLATGGLQTGMANQSAAQQTGSNLSNAAMNTGSNVANVYGNLGNTLANSALAQGQAQANMYQNMANYGSQQQQGMGQLAGLLGAGVGAYMGGPTGAAAGGKIGGAIGGLLGTSL